MGSSTTVLSLVIATLAVALSLITVVLQRRQQQREAYRGIYEVLMSEQLQRGRWLIGEISQPGDLPEDRSPDHYLIYRTLGWFETLAMYDQRRVVPRRWALDVWHHSLRDINTGATVMLGDRLGRGQDHAPWPHLWSLLDDAVNYQSRMLCCHSQSLGARSPAHSQHQTPGQVAGLDKRESRYVKTQRARSILAKTVREFRRPRDESRAEMVVSESNVEQRPDDEALRHQYDQVCASYHGIDDFRGKLLALWPILGGAAGGVALLATKDGNFSSYLWAIGLFGTLVAIGLAVYEWTQTLACQELKAVGRQLERDMGFKIGKSQFRTNPGAFNITFKAKNVAALEQSERERESGSQPKSMRYPIRVRLV